MWFVGDTEATARVDEGQANAGRQRQTTGGSDRRSDVIDVSPQSHIATPITIATSPASAGGRLPYAIWSTG